MQLNSKDLLSMQQLSAAEIRLILDTAVGMKQAVLSGHKDHPSAGQIGGHAVLRNSTRTRLSFEMAAKFMEARRPAMFGPAAAACRKGPFGHRGHHRFDGHRLHRHAPPVPPARPRFLADRVRASVINRRRHGRHPTQCLQIFSPCGNTSASWKV